MAGKETLVQFSQNTLADQVVRVSVPAIDDPNTGITLWESGAVTTKSPPTGIKYTNLM